MDSSPVTFHAATEADIPFLVEAHYAAECSGTNVHPYCRLYDISQDHWAHLLADIFAEELEGCEFGLETYLVAKQGNERLATCSAWVEAYEASPSALIKAQVLRVMLGEAKLSAVTERLRTAQALNLDRTHGSLQLESFYTLPKARGQGLAGKLIARQVAHWRQQVPSLARAEIQLMGAHETARHAYERMGFTQDAEAATTDPNITELMPGSSKIRLVKSL